MRARNIPRSMVHSFRGFSIHYLDDIREDLPVVEPAIEKDYYRNIFITGTENKKLGARNIIWNKKNGLFFEQIRNFELRNISS